MAESSNGSNVMEDETEQRNGKREDKFSHQRKGKVTTQTLPQVLNRLVSAILFPQPGGSFLRQLKNSVAENVPLLPEASRNSARDILLWTRGSPLRSLLVISVGMIALVALTGLIVFMLFFLAATVNAIVISLLISLAAAGGFLALFFAFATAIYIGALSVAVFAISVTTFWTIVAILITSGWIGFFYTAWLVARKSFGFAKHSLSATGSVIASYSTVRKSRHLLHKDSD